MNGIFAIEKPSGITSNQFMLKLQHALTKSQVFSKEIQRATAERKQQYEKQTGKKASKRKLRKVSKVKMGHGGTLDPLASGVLVIGIGAGTKKLANYLSGTVKVYESEALFGVSTTSGDVEGEILSQNSVKHLNFDDLKTVEEKFVGQLKQTPPIYAALKMDGKPLHEYAREGKPLPRAIEPRQVTIYDLKVFSDSLKRDHDYPLLRPTTEEAVDTVKNLNANMLNDVLYFSKEYTEKHSLDSEVAKVEEPFPLSEQEEQEIQKEGDSYRAPKLHFKANVSSGTYIRSLVSDIGKSMRSSCYMVKLIRLQQQDWSLEKNNVFQLTDFTERDEKVWSKVLEKVLDEGATVDVIEELKKAEKEIPADVKECIVSSDQPGDEATAETIETANTEEHSNTLKRKIEQV
ncbi:BBM_1a_G0043770.mRNA.1.CDS.1 [Saccharomyces cerevisiae]|nr:Pus4p [Saccharomyces cerevisiae YJM1399]CAI4719647.1 BBM_1a_G0043770.mRNA.1.CDS.1 [Saccharomyces cerevisiae]CAI4728416.1 ADE_G0043670.mRNA.1.CDS.1 [Saccharomyces cerevisiae]CAI6852212.1 ADE_G0043670.mRNA.1.CDS.1 [Saccharomyces cerevisiae]CAI7291398.1 BBM_1a_G0043770.mRNA.1.CDS.1 [Saccharomyces cerevisiae]